MYEKYRSGVQQSNRMNANVVMNNFDSNSLQQEPTQSEIQSFYQDATVLLTGATGFMGNLILEKLLRTCSGIKRVYILIREKKGKTTEERFKEMFNDSVFELMKTEQPDYLEKVSAVIGDCGMPNLGIEEKYQEILKNEVNIILHSAATVRFDEHLRLAVNTNIIALQDLLKLSQKMKDLKAFVHISTAYSNCAGRKDVKEQFYELPISGDKLSNLVNVLDDDYITRLTPSLLREWPNTYAMTKAIAEGEILTYGKGLPVGILRPSMIIATYNEPISGWINNFYGPTGVVAAAGVGLMRCMKASPKAIADVVPGDYVSNAVLACAWDVHNQWKAKENSTVQNHNEENNQYVPPIFNLVSSSSNPITWGEFSKINQKYGMKIPSVKAIFPLMLILTGNKIEYAVLCFLLHTIPGFTIDFLAKLMGKTPKLMDAYKKINKFSNIISYFSTRSWTFHDENTRSLISRLSKKDQELFSFNISQLDWEDYFQKHVVGIRHYILKDPITSLPEGKKHEQKLYLILYTIMSILVALFLLMLYALFKVFI